MKRTVIFLCLFLMISAPVFAFLYDIELPTRDEIKKMTNAQILSLYTDIMIERKANETFHERAGFTPNEYKKYKQLLRVIIDIRSEMLARKMEVPPIEDWLN